ncbi:hypothetical protein F5Y16DRAFT_375495 [Xylariaceae sp. FL0255]|nr:hypothetical protein F5Y16DRAFT_375495 [Xylariaceae sp. FL0255]
MPPNTRSESYSVVSHETTHENHSEHISLSWPEDYVSTNPDDLIRGEPMVFGGEDPEKRVLFRPQVTVNVFNTGGSSTGGSSEGGSGSGTGGTGTGGQASVTGGGRLADGDGNEFISGLASQLAALTKKVEHLSSAAKRGPAIECGDWGTDNVRSSNPPQQATQARINFAKPFNSVPTVMVSINAADVSNAKNFRVTVYATAVDVKGFTINANSWYDSLLYSCGVSWLAIGE